MLRVAEMRGQLGLQHLLQRISKQAGENAILARSLSSMLFARASSCWIRSTDGSTDAVRCWISAMVFLLFCFASAAVYRRPASRGAHHLHNLFYTLVPADRCARDRCLSE